MKKTINVFAKLALAIICFAGVLLVAGCNEKELVNIGLSANIKTQYLLNENIDLNGAKLVLTYSDDSQNELVISSDMITVFDTTTIGERALTITYKGKQINVDYVVLDFDDALRRVQSKIFNAEKVQAVFKVNVGTENETIHTKVTVNNNCLKELHMNSSGAEGNYTIYNLATNKEYSSETNSVSNSTYTKEQIYTHSYLGAYIDSSNTITNKLLTINARTLVLTYKITVSGNTFDIVAVVGTDYRVQTININHPKGNASLTYDFDNVPTIDWIYE